MATASAVARTSPNAFGAERNSIRSPALKTLASSFRAFKSVARLGGLPTVWSDCLAGWWLGGRGNTENLPFLFAGATFLYLGATFANDVFDTEFDQHHHPARPIPSGRVSWKTVWHWALGWLALGALSWLCLGKLIGGFGLAMIVCIVIFDSVHRLLALSPLLLGACRLLLYLAAASAGADGVTGWSVWCGLAVAAYVAGLGYFKQWVRTPDWEACGPGLLLACPIILALMMDANAARPAGLLLSAILGLWTIRCLRPLLWSPLPNVRVAISGLSAGIVFVDWLAVADAPRSLGFVFLALFGAAVLLERLAAAD